MFNEEWWQSKNKSKELTLGWLYNNDIKDDFAKGYTKNLTDYWSVEMSNFIWHNFASDTITDLLKQAYDNRFSKILVFKQGCMLRNDDFYTEFVKFYDDNSDAKFVGHILDHNETYYRIHPQTFLIDLNWWADAGFPEWGEWKNESFETIEPIRSEENHHDEYTPHWISPGKQLRTYSGKREGWNLVRALIEDGQTIMSWPKEVRVTKYYAYAEVDEDGPRHRGDLMEQLETDVFFIANTETLPNLEKLIDYRSEHTFPKWDKKFQRIITPAAGLSTLIFAFKLNLQKHDNIVVYDCSNTGLKFTRKIIEEWDGSDYFNFSKEMMKDGSVNWRGYNKIKNVDRIIEELEGFEKWVNEILPFIEVKYLNIDILKPSNYEELTDNLTQDTVTYLHLSNIFHYMPTSFYYSLQQRWQLCNDLLIKLKEVSKNNNILVYAARGAGQCTPMINWIDDCEIFKFSDIPETNPMKLLKWNKGTKTEQIDDKLYIRNLNIVKQFIDKCCEKTHYEDLKLPDEKFKRWKEDNSLIPQYCNWIVHHSNTPSLVLNIPVPYKEMAAEAEQFIGRYIKHRGGWNPGWSSIVVHGQDIDRTQDAKWYIEEGIDTEENSAPYDWTSIAKDCPVTVDWLKNKFPFDEFHRVRFMLIEPGGYIKPHQDFDTRSIAAFNVSLSNPPGVQFAVEDAGLIPWQPGEVRGIDIGRKHSVLHNGTENRIHMIVHGLWGKGFERCIIESFEQLLINIGHINN